MLRPIYVLGEYCYYLVIALGMYLSVVVRTLTLFGESSRSIIDPWCELVNATLLHACQPKSGSKGLWHPGKSNWFFFTKIFADCLAYPRRSFRCVSPRKGTMPSWDTRPNLPACGKTSLMRRCVGKYLDDRYIPTVLLDFVVKSFEIDATRVRLQIVSPSSCSPLGNGLAYLSVSGTVVVTRDSDLGLVTFGEYAMPHLSCSTSPLASHSSVLDMSLITYMHFHSKTLSQVLVYGRKMSNKLLFGMA